MLAFPLVSSACSRARTRIDPVPAQAQAPDGTALSPPALSPAGDDAASILVAKQLMVPVEGVTPDGVSDTYNAPRAGGAHRALDILAPRGTPVLAADGGRIFKLRSNANGGITIYAIDREERFIYYYAHLERYRDGLREGDLLEAGDVIGYVGTSGNAPPNVPHLHFQIMRYRGDGKYWDGDPIDPHAYLSRRGARRNP